MAQRRWVWDGKILGSFRYRKSENLLGPQIANLVSTSSKFGTCTVVCLNVRLVEEKMLIHSMVKVNILASTIVPVRPTTVHVTNLALTRQETDNSVYAYLLINIVQHKNKSYS
jgi:hypothetical protein